MKRRWFDVLLLAALGISTTLVLTLILVQGAYTGPREPLRALTEPDVQGAIYLSFMTSGLAAVIAILLAVPTGLALARFSFPGRWLVESLLVVPIVMSPISLGVALLLVFRSGPGEWIEDHLIRFVFEVPGIVLAEFFMAYAISVLVVRSTFSAIDARLEQVARFLGCTPWRAFRHVSLPLARNGILAAFVLGWARAMGDFGASSTIAGAVKGKTETMPVSIYLNLASVSLNRAIALSLVLTFVTVVVVIVVGLLMRRSS
ncbi:MAG: ABC transporter permease subunit [Phycisphaerae bacterium]|jgi:molybdate transport system permease protein